MSSEEFIKNSAVYNGSVKNVKIPAIQVTIPEIDFNKTRLIHPRPISKSELVDIILSDKTIKESFDEELIVEYVNFCLEDHNKIPTENYAELFIKDLYAQLDAFHEMQERESHFFGSSVKETTDELRKMFAYESK